MHYAVARILANSGNLARFYTDICATQGPPVLLRHLPANLQSAPVRRLAGRVPCGIPDRLITTFASFGLRYSLRRMMARTKTQETRTALWAGRHFSDLVIRHGFGHAAGFYGFSGECLEQLQAARERGMWTAVEQIIAPRTIVDELLGDEYQRFPHWETPEMDAFADEYARREREEWANADLIVCGSDYVREGVIACGGDADRCVVVPYGVDQRFAVPGRRPHAGRLRVLTIGAVGLRKGSPYVAAAAERLKGSAEFRVIGVCSGEARAAFGEAADLIGAVPRSDIVSHYGWADVFLLPSICEGSATVVYEALMAGLPVITTRNTGTVVRDGLDGFIVPIRDTEAIVEALDRLASDRGLLAAMSSNARQRAAEFDLDRYGQRLRQALRACEVSSHRASRNPEAMGIH